jgi:hypothetical protein
LTVFASKNPKLDRDNVIAKLIHTNLDPISKTNAVGGLKLELSVYDDLGR